MYYCTEVHGGVVSGRQGLTTKKLGRAEGTEGTQGRAGHDVVGELCLELGLGLRVGGVWGLEQGKWAYSCRPAEVLMISDVS